MKATVFTIKLRKSITPHISGRDSGPS